MKSYTFWNYKGGTGKTCLCFQCVLEYAIKHDDEHVLIVDLCPQANHLYFTGDNVIMEVRYFQTSGVAAFAEAKSFSQLQNDRRVRTIGGQQVQLDIKQIRNNFQNISAIVDRL